MNALVDARADGGNLIVHKVRLISHVIKAKGEQTLGKAEFDTLAF